MPYLFDDAADQTRRWVSTLEARYDPATCYQLAATGLRQGWTCLTIGAGTGSIGAWLARETGTHGTVVIADADPDHIHGRIFPPNVRFAGHDIATDPLAPGAFDLVHARLALARLPRRLDVLDCLISALKPGGWLVLEEVDFSWSPVLTAPSHAAGLLFERVHDAILRALETAGVDILWGRKTYAAMQHAGLTGLTAETYAEAWPGGGEGIGLHRAAVHHITDTLVRDLGEPDVKNFLALLDDPCFAVNSYPMVSVRGRRPEVTA